MKSTFWAREYGDSRPLPSMRGRVVSMLEGGYDLKALADSASAHVKALMAS